MDLFTAERAALRAQIKERRAALNREEIESLSAHLTTRALAHPYLQTQQCVASFVSFGQEVETRNLNLELKRRGHLLALPVISETEKGLMDFYTYNDEQSFNRNRFNIPEPPPESARKVDPYRFSLVLLPLCAFDLTGARLGMGGGYYDRLLKKLNPCCLKIGLAFDLQQVPAIPTASWDMPLDEILTPTRHIICHL